jgi:hypothetical protein
LSHEVEKKAEEKRDKGSRGSEGVDKQVKMTDESFKIQNLKSQILISNKYFHWLFSFPCSVWKRVKAS